MSRQIDLSKVLKSLRVSCDDVKYGFASIDDKHIKLTEQILGIFKEQEGLTIIAPKEYFEKNKIKYDGPFAKLTIETQTSLELIGLTAVISKKLADENISVNVIAGYYHDHIFVQYNLRQKAIKLLNS